MADEPDQDHARRSTRVTADLPEAEYAALEEARVLNAASTTDITKALLRLYASDPRMADRVTTEIMNIRREKLESRRNGRIWTRRRGRGDSKEASAA
ncbi:hypothetical protein QIS99_28715 [Streptomyces sp. B-S-A8]|uniref:Uncharacterized protein n=1 Tax=Streptomyces solicavernae TaxID=3043614 RepID=A0ABT6S2C4_9ACTN|nr:hypothetical protein [Streptomyces sp. B-S-A8]MDI3390143.1 hypothetical protein [Streptomyces sp. B-S-A8]